MGRGGRIARPLRSRSRSHPHLNLPPRPHRNSRSPHLGTRRRSVGQVQLHLLETEKVRTVRNIPGDNGPSSSSSVVPEIVTSCTVSLRDIDACVIVELLPLDPPELFVAVVRDVIVERSEGDVKRPRAAASTER